MAAQAQADLEWRICRTGLWPRDSMANIAMLGTGLIGLFYTMSLSRKRSRDKVVVVQGRDPGKTAAFAEKHGIPRSTTSLEEAVSLSDVDLAVVGLPNHLHKDAVRAAARAGKG